MNHKPGFVTKNLRFLVLEFPVETPVQPSIRNLYYCHLSWSSVAGTFHCSLPVFNQRTIGGVWTFGSNSKEVDVVNLPTAWLCSWWVLAVPAALPPLRWALTPPFHPFPAIARWFAFCCAVCRKTISRFSPGRYPASCPAEPGLSSMRLL